MEKEKKVKGIEEGPPIYMESLLNAGDYFTCSNIYKGTYRHRAHRTLSEFALGLFKCRYRMGGGLTTEEITHINKEIDELREKLGNKSPI